MAGLDGAGWCLNDRAHPNDPERAMPCESLEEFKTLATYRKSFNGDLHMAKSRPVKFAVFDGFKFEKDQKQLLLVVGTIPNELRDALKKNAASLKATGLCSFAGGVVEVTLKSGKLTPTELERGLKHAGITKECKVADGSGGGAEESVDNDEADDEQPGRPLPPGLAKASATFQAANAQLEAFMKERVSALTWHDDQIKTQQDAERMVTQVNAAIQGFEDKIVDARTKSKNLANELKELAKDKEVAKYQKTQLTKLAKAVADQGVLIAALEQKIAAQRRLLPELELKANKHGSTRHGAQTDLSLQARRAATGGISPDQRDNVHGVSTPRVDDPDVAEPVQSTKQVWKKTANADGSPIDGTALKRELRWRNARITVVTKDGEGAELDVPELHKAIITQVKDMDAVATSTASKFHSHELEREAVQRAIAKVSRECVWTEILDGETWKPLNSVTVYLGAPAKSVGWGMAMQRQTDPKMALDKANVVIERFRQGKISQEAMLKELDVAMATVEEEVKGRKSVSVPMVKSARVTLGRTSAGWTSITHFPDPAATPPDWSLTGSFVRVNAKGPKVTAPRGSTA
jgi:hypothetical protein